MRNIVIARHGQDEDNARGVFNGRRDNSLTAKGRDDARALALNLKNHPDIDIGWIFCSPLKRARETTRIVASKLISRYAVVDSLTEMNYGVLEGRPYSEIQHTAKNWTGVDGYWYISEVEGAESYPELCVRACDALSEIKKIAEKFQVRRDGLIICHGAIGKAIQVAHKQLPWEHFFETQFLYNCQFKVLE